MATLQELLEQKNALDRQIREAQSSQKSEAIAQIRKLMADNGLTPADLAGGVPTRKTGKGDQSVVRRPVAAKYKHPESGATWTGRGLKPKWLSEELAKGKSLSDFAL
jgi:DNA-binding protein H-NS